MSCVHCGQPLPEAGSRSCPHCGEPVTPSRAGLPPEVAKAASSAAEATRRAAGHTANAVKSVLEDPRLRERIPGRSLALLGAGLVTLALVLSMLPTFHSIGVGWSVVMLAGSLLIGARELHAAGRALPEPVVRAARVAERPIFLPAFTILTFVQAILTLGFGIVPLLWLLAAVVLGYDQRRALAAFVAEQGSPGPAEKRLGRWVLAGSLVCVAALFFSWGYGRGGYFVGGIQPYHVRDMQMDGFTRQYTDRYEYRFTPMMNWVPAYAASGRGRPYASGVLLGLGGLVGLTRARRMRASLPPWVLPVLAGVVTLWGIAGLASAIGPWLFLAGALLVDVAVARDFMQRPRAGSGA
ncbi:zinc ribbon domain-containing protein [Hyalangium sp.]|uniref:zinc ribbon domain-containing protein n=1 Tax=Hyalangium sp. TaxID=2028555 RepID=UPI002D6711C3|nr:zinc ribbon domain-containing protein [Hyalangium sp.]HYI00911.1 zinc ribbon domain-containing protein [Hyalangium sp.]